MKNQHYNRRKFLLDGTKTTLAVGIGLSVAGNILNSCASSQKNIKNNSNLWAPGYEQSILPYDWSDLEPVIDKETMNLHYTKHAATYLKNMKEALAAEKVDINQINIVQLLQNISRYSNKMRNNVGGHYNHELFWQFMKPGGNKKPTDKFLAAIEKNFVSFSAFKTRFEDAAKERFGSGWAWLVLNNEGKLIIGSTPNQDNPLMDICELKGIPLLALDIWEHAYYLKYRNRRDEYANNWWKVVNWTVVQNRFNLIS